MSFHIFASFHCLRDVNISKLFYLEKYVQFLQCCPSMTNIKINKSHPTYSCANSNGFRDIKLFKLLTFEKKTKVEKYNFCNVALRCQIQNKRMADGKMHSFFIHLFLCIIRLATLTRVNHTHTRYSPVRPEKWPCRNPKLRPIQRIQWYTFFALFLFSNTLMTLCVFYFSFRRQFIVFPILNFSNFSAGDIISRMGDIPYILHVNSSTGLLSSRCLIPSVTS